MLQGDDAHLEIADTLWQSASADDAVANLKKLANQRLSGKPSLI
jgi:hypothetical protein